MLLFRKEVRKRFRDRFIEHFNSESRCKYKMYSKYLEWEEVEVFVNQNFRLLNGTSFYNSEHHLLIAVHITGYSEGVLNVFM